MAFPDEELSDEERLLVHERPHPVLLVIPALVFVVVCGLTGYLGAVLHRVSWWATAYTALAVVAGALVAWFSVLPLLRWASTHFVVTDRRLLVREGVFQRVGFEIPLDRIDGLHVRQGPLERLLGSGSLSIESSAGSEGGPIEFDQIPRVRRVYLVLRDVLP